MVNEPNPYTSLGLLPGSSQTDIKRRYRQMAKLYHPDCNGQDPKAETRFREINAAHDFLSDPARKAVFDAAFAAAYNPARLPQTKPLVPHRRRATPLRAMIGLTMLLMLSTGVGVLFNAVNGFPALARLTSGKTAVPDRPAPAYSFMPSSSPFDQNSAGAPASAETSTDTQP